jgi:hypothetical protein
VTTTCAPGDLAADLGGMLVHRVAIGGGQDEARTHASRRTDRAEQVGPAVALVARRRRSTALVGPDAGQRALLADAGFDRLWRSTLPPEFDRLAAGVLPDRAGDQVG